MDDQKPATCTTPSSPRVRPITVEPTYGNRGNLENGKDGKMARRESDFQEISPWQGCARGSEGMGTGTGKGHKTISARRGHSGGLSQALGARLCHDMTGRRKTGGTVRSVQLATVLECQRNALKPWHRAPTAWTRIKFKANGSCIMVSAFRFLKPKDPEASAQVQTRVSGCSVCTVLNDG